MVENEANTSAPENQSAVLDAEDWPIALAPYEGNPSPALSLGFLLMALRGYLSIEPLKVQETVEAIDSALEVLFPHTEFHEVSLDLFRRVIAGQITRDEEELLHALGIKF